MKKSINLHTFRVGDEVRWTRFGVLTQGMIEFLYIRPENTAYIHSGTGPWYSVDLSILELVNPVVALSRALEENE